MEMFWKWFGLFIAASWLAGCGGVDNAQRQLHGTLLVWHTWPAPQATIMDSFLDSFMEINPDVVIVSEYVPAEELLARFIDQATAGLGPDLLMGIDPVTVRTLVEQGLLADLTPYEPDTSNLRTPAVSALQLDEQLFGLPLAAHTQVLFFNKNRVQQPPRTLDEILEIARNEQIVTLPTDFQRSFWGVRGYGGNMTIDGDKIEITEGLVEWLEWLQTAQKEPNIILSDDPEELYELFASGRATYYVGESIRLPQLRERLGEGAVGVAYLPDNKQEEQTEDGAEIESAQELYSTSEPAGSFLELEVAAVSGISSKKELALALILFLINPVHQRKLATSDLGQVPINRRVRFDHRMSPAETTIVRQSGTSTIVSLQDIYLVAQLSDVANGVYAQVLEGVLEPEEGALLIQEELRLVLTPQADDGS